MAYSIEHSRTRAYSMDIRWRVVYRRIGMGQTLRSIAQDLHIALGTVYSWWRRFGETGDVSPTNRHARLQPSLLDEGRQTFLVALVSNNPTLYLAEISRVLLDVTGSMVSPSTVCRTLHKLGFSRKRVRLEALQRWPALRGAFIVEVNNFPVDWLVFVDETGSDRRTHARKEGWAVLGERAVDRRLLVRGQRINSVVAMDCCGTVAVDCSFENCTGARFFDFLRGVLFPEMGSFPGQRSVLVMDNCSIHRIQEIAQLATDFEIIIMFLPPYSPDLNPIELLFSYSKGVQRALDDLLQLVENPLPLVEETFWSVTRAQCAAWCRHCFYQTW